MRFPFQSAAAVRALRKPQHVDPPEMASAEVAALYRAARTGGDFFDFVLAGSRLLILLLDIAGERDEALDIAAAAQDAFRGGADLLLAEDVNQAVALTQLVLDINRAILQAAGGVRCAPAFLGCYNQSLGTLFYINAGHTPALLRENGEVAALEASGLPLGLFSHAVHEAQMSVLAAGAALLVVSRGLVEARSGGEEFGLERVKRVLAEAAISTSEQLCRHVLDSVKLFVESATRRTLLGRTSARTLADHEPLGQNDTTALALLRLH